MPVYCGFDLTDGAEIIDDFHHTLVLDFDGLDGLS